jgi:hypothetical protein
MVAPTAQILGLGADGYARLQKESAYNTPLTNAMKDLKILPETAIKLTNEIIENLNQVNSRIKQDPNTAGRIIVAGQIAMDIDPTVIGALMDLALDQSAVSGAAGTGYTHTYLAPVSGDKVANSFTIQQAMGGALADQFNGCIITGFEISSDNQKNQTITFDIVGCSNTADVARATSFSFGAVQPFSFGQTSISLVFDGFTTYVQKVNSMKLKINLGYLTENYKLGSRYIEQPVFKSIPTAELTLQVDADATLLEFARSQAACAITITTTHSVLAGSSSGAYSYIIEIPKARIKSDQELKNSNERLVMDLGFDIYGGTTTGSGTANVPFEIRVVDAVATYA